MKKNSSWKKSILGLIIIPIMLLLFYVGTKNQIIWLEDLIPPLFGSATTLLVGFFAFILYKKQKDDVKNDASSIILLEIQNAEKVIKLAQRSLEKSIPELLYDAVTMPTDSWDKNKYLFVTDFDNNEWEAINNFYSACRLFDESVRTNASYFHKDEQQVRVNIQKRSAKLTWNYSKKIAAADSLENKEKLRKELRSKIDEETTLYLGAVATYSPKKVINDAKLCIETIKLNISLPSAINKLKNLTK